MKLRFMAFVFTMTGLCSAHAENMRLFNSDGCSGSPDSIAGYSIIHCCIAHDFDYWIGGDETQKIQADKTLKQCIQASVPMPLIGDIYALGVNIGGSPKIMGAINSPFLWRWGFGWEQNHGFTPSTKEQLTAALVDLQNMESNLDAQERALNETKGYAWRFRSLKISHAQFVQIRIDLQKKISEIKNTLSADEEKAN